MVCRNPITTRNTLIDLGRLPAPYASATQVDIPADRQADPVYRPAGDMRSVGRYPRGSQGKKKTVMIIDNNHNRGERTAGALGRDYDTVTITAVGFKRNYKNLPRPDVVMTVSDITWITQYVKNAYGEVPSIVAKTRSGSEHVVGENFDLRRAVERALMDS